MQKPMSDHMHDAIWTEIATLRNGLERERNKRKVLQDLVLEIMDKQPLVRMKLTDEGKDALAELES